VVAGFFSQKTDRDRAKWIARQHAAITDLLTKKATGEALRSEVRRVLGPRGIVPFHWPLEFPEVFDGERTGFDAFVGNPPFLGGTRISTNYGSTYLEWLTTTFDGTGNRTDFVAYFFRRAFSYLRSGGTLGLIATNTIAQGDTRSASLRWICRQGGTIYEARRRYKWPGLAAVVVAVVHIAKGAWVGTHRLDGHEVPVITAFLFHRGGHDDPAVLPVTAGSYFTGSAIYSQGFLFDDQDKKRDTVSSLAEMRALLKKDTRNSERILPYLGGEELNDDPEQRPHRHVINFGEMTEPEARKWPDLMAIVEAKVRPGRMQAPAEVRSLPWWLFQRSRPELYRAIGAKSRVLANSKVSQHLIFAWLPTGLIYSHKLGVIAEDRDSFLAVIQSRIHEAWARFFSSTLEDRLNYSPSDCFETFPFPRGWEESAALEDIGRRYDAHRAAVMKRTIGTKKPEGLTATYTASMTPTSAPPRSRRCARSTRRWTARCSTPTAGRTCGRRTTAGCSSTSGCATRGTTTRATRCSRGCWRRTGSGRVRSRPRRELGRRETRARWRWWHRRSGGGRRRAPPRAGRGCPGWSEGREACVNACAIAPIQCVRRSRQVASGGSDDNRGQRQKSQASTILELRGPRWRRPRSSPPDRSPIGLRQAA